MIHALFFYFAFGALYEYIHTGECSAVGDGVPGEAVGKASPTTTR